MKASEARDITNSTKTKQIDIWWDNYKNRLFDEIKAQANIGLVYVEISEKSKLNDENIIENGDLSDRLKKEVEKLGYECHSFNGSYQSDDKCICISW